MRNARLAPALLALALGCAGRAPLLREARVAEIRPGETREEEILGWFGSPDAVRRDPGGGAHWGYQRERRRPSRGLVGRWLRDPLINWFEDYVFFPPPSPAGDRRVRDRLAVDFDAGGFVTSFEFERLPPAE
jgi:outer membrane protein assembly factor BamE (lipoprotein component of BamABCDE complex)